MVQSADRAACAVEWGPLFREKQLWLLILIGILYFYEPLFTDRTFFYRDLYIHFFPQKCLFVHTVKGGELPLWDPYVHGGQPFLGDVQNLALYPTNILYLLLPVITAFNLDLVLHLISCSVITYLLARVLKFSPAAAFLTAILYGYNGYTLSLANLMNRMLAMPYLPLSLMLWHLFLAERRWRWFALTAIAGSFQIFAGAPETTLITFAFILLWSVLYSYSGSILRRVALWLLLVTFITGLSAVQLLPGIEMIGQSSRALPENYKEFAGWSLNPLRLPEMVVPKFLGTTDKLTRRDYWGGKHEDTQFPYILSIYFGAISLIFSIGAVFRNEESPLPSRIRIFLFLVLLSSILFSLGRFLPFFETFYKTAIFVNRLRYPVKFMVAAILPASLLAAGYTETLFAPERKPVKTLITLWIFSGCLLALLFAFRISDNLYTSFLSFYFGQTAGAIRQGIQGTLARTGTLCLALTLLLQLRTVRLQGWHRWAFTGIVALDLLHAGYSVNSYASREFFRVTPNLARLVLKEAEGGRFFRGIDPKAVRIKLPENDVVYMYRWTQETLENYVAAGYGVPVIYHEDYDGLAKREIRRLASFVHSVPWERRGAVLTVSAVNIIFTAEQVHLPGVQLVAGIRTPSNSLYYLYRNTSSQRVRFVSRAKWASSGQQAFEQVTGPAFDPVTEVVLQDAEDSSQDRGPASVRHGERAGPQSEAPTCDASIEKTISRINTASYRVTNPCDGYLVFSEPYYPGWQILVDEKPVRILPANFAFSAIRLEAGAHRVVGTYAPASFRFGLAITTVTTILLVSILFFCTKRQPRSLFS